MKGVSLPNGVSTSSTNGLLRGVSLPNGVSTCSINGLTARPTTGDYCGYCGEPSDGGERLAMEPPRYCAACRRRMKVQVAPLGWTAECSRHGVIAS
jgi:hypothetical protein